MFEVGECIKHNRYGICQIDKIRMRKMSNGKKRQYYDMHTLQGIETTISSPVDNDDLLPVTSLETIDELLEVITKLPSVWIDDNRQRADKFQQLLNKGDIFELSAMITTLYAKREEKRNEGKSLPVNDIKLLEQAETKLHNELAFQLEIDPSKVSAFIAETVKQQKEKK